MRIVDLEKDGSTFRPAPQYAVTGSDFLEESDLRNPEEIEGEVTFMGATKKISILVEQGVWGPYYWARVDDVTKEVNYG